MNHRLARLVLALVTTLAAGCVSPDPDPPAARREALVPAALHAAHEAYLDGSLIALGERVRDVLLDPGAGELARENALELLDKAYEANAGRLPSSWELPQGIDQIHFGCINGMSPEGPHHRIYVRVRMRDASRITGVTVRRLPDETLLDTASSQGELQIKHDEPGFEDYNLDAHVAALPADGVFTVRIERADAAPAEGWFIGRSLASTALPELRSPVSSPSFSERNPVVSWVPFRSPQYAAFEHRTLSIYVNGKTAAGETAPWDFWSGEPGELGQIRIGDHPGMPRIALDPGDYWLAFSAGEGRRFGPVRVRRTSRRVEHFHVLR